MDLSPNSDCPIAILVVVWQGFGKIVATDNRALSYMLCMSFGALIFLMIGTM